MGHGIDGVFPAKSDPRDNSGKLTGGFPVNIWSVCRLVPDSAALYLLWVDVSIIISFHTIPYRQFFSSTYIVKKTEITRPPRIRGRSCFNEPLWGFSSPWDAKSRFIKLNRLSLTSQEGFEPPTDGLEGRCSIQLSYWDTKYVRRMRYLL